MKTTFALVLAVVSLSAAACDDGGSKTATTTPAAPAASPPPAPAPAPAPAASTIPGLSAPYATEAAWVAGCKETGLDVTICDCAVKATMKELGAQGLYTWVWEGYIKREGMGQVRSRKWFKDNNIDKPDQQKFADAIGKCYVTQ